MGMQPVVSSNVAPALTDPELIKQTDLEREKIFAAIIDDPTNLDFLFKYANLSILLGDLEAAISVFEQMLISVSYTHLTLPTILRV